MRHILALGFAAISVAAAATPALAAPPVTWEAPAGGATVPRGWTGPASFRVHEAAPVRFAVSGPKGYAWETTATPAPGDVGGVFQLATIAPFVAPGEYTATVARMDGSDADTRIWNVARVNQASILSPLGGNWLVGYGGPVVVRWTELRDPAATYSVRLNGSAVCSYAGTLTDGAQTSCPLPPLGQGSHHVQVFGETGGQALDEVWIDVLPSLAVLSRSVSPAIFWPIVRDGYRDTTLFRFRLNQQAQVVVRVRNAAGRVVRSAALGSRSSGSWHWNGRTNSGTKAKPGFYRIYLTASNGLQTRQSSAARVRVKTGLVTRYGSRTYPGNGGPGTIQAAGGLCFYYFGLYSPNGLYLDCWGGGWIRSNYLFTIPASAFSFRWRVNGSQHCCYRGLFQRTGERISARRYRVRVTIGGWRAYDIRSVSLRWAYKQRR